MGLIERISAETPKWFKRIIHLGIIVAGVGTALLAVDGTVPGFTLPPMMVKVAQWMIVAGVVAGAVSKTAKESSTKEP